VAYQTLDVRVPGGSLRVGQWGNGPAVIVAAHGASATHLHFEALADQLGEEVTVLAPDLRGRGRSRAVGGPYGIARHADDLIAVMDHAGITETLAVGHSLGAFVAVAAAVRHPGRVRDLVLVDGGLPLAERPSAPDVPAAEALRAVGGPAAQRLGMTFPSQQAYLDFWRQHPALAADWNDYIEHAYGYDLAGSPPELASSVREEVVLGDIAELRDGHGVERALGQLTCPAVLVRAPVFIDPQQPPMYSDTAVAAGRQLAPQLGDVLVPGVNHYTIVLTSRGAGAVADVIRGRLRARDAGDALG